MKTTITILGCGRWGSFLAWYCNSIGHKTTLWGKPDTRTFEILKASSSVQYSGVNEFVALPKSIDLTSDLEQAISASELVLIAISAQNLREFLDKGVVRLLDGKEVVLNMKGVECGTGYRLTQVAQSSGIAQNRLAVWVGPGHIQDFVKGVPNCMLIDSHNLDLTHKLVDTLKSNLIRFYYGKDIIGTEVGAATKNIVGIIAGMLDGVNLTALKGPLMARGAVEMGRLIKAMGGNYMSAFGLCHLGDYETTLFSPHSNNRKWGEAFAKGQSFEKLAEGVATTHAITTIGKRLNIDLPLTYALAQTLNGTIPPIKMLQTLFDRPTKEEFY